MNKTSEKTELFGFGTEALRRRGLKAWGTQTHGLACPFCGAASATAARSARCHANEIARKPHQSAWWDVFTESTLLYHLHRSGSDPENKKIFITAEVDPYKDTSAAAEEKKRRQGWRSDRACTQEAQGRWCEWKLGSFHTKLKQKRNQWW